jgi:hypothetical protein
MVKHRGSWACFECWYQSLKANVWVCKFGRECHLHAYGWVVILMGHGYPLVTIRRDRD